MLIKFYSSYDLFEDIDSYIKHWIYFYGNCGDKVDRKTFLHNFNIPIIDDFNVSLEIIPSFLRISRNDDDVRKFTYEILSHGLTVENIIEKANDLYKTAYNYQINRKMEDYLSLLSMPRQNLRDLMFP